MRNWLNSIKRLLSGKTKRPLPLPTREQPRRRKLRVEWLEDRITPNSTLSFAGGVLTFTASPTNHNLTVSVSAGTYTITDFHADGIDLSGLPTWTVTNTV